MKTLFIPLLLFCFALQAQVYVKTGGSLQVKVGGSDVVVNSPAVGASEEPFFQSDFEDANISTNYFKIEGTSWVNFEAEPEIDGNNINYEGAAPEYGFAAIRHDTTDANNHCLYFQNNKKYGSKARVQDVISFNVDTIHSYRSQYRFYLHPDIESLESYSGNLEYYSMFEIWEEHNDSWDGNSAGQAYWTLYLMKPTGVGEHLYWMIEGDYMQPAEVQDVPMWTPLHNHVVPVPYGQWATLDYTFVPGEGAAGHILITLTVGSETDTLFDVHNHTTYPDYSKPVSWYEPFKSYMPAEWTDYLNSNNKKCAVWYDDFKFWIE